jgi:integrase/recombinase XerD
MSQDPENTALAAEPFGNAGKDRARGGAREAAPAAAIAARLDPQAVKAALRDYLAALKRDKSTINRYVTCLNRFFVFLDKKGGGDLRAVTRADIAEYQAEISTATWTVHTTHAHLRAVRRLYEFLDDQGKILMNPAAGIRMPKLERALPRNVLTRSEMRRLLDEPDTSLPGGVRDRTLMEVLYSTGIRVAELCHLTVHDVDLLNGYLRVNCGKGCKDRVVPLGKKARAYVNEYMRHVRGILTRKMRDERALFVGARHHRGGLSTTRIAQIVRHYARRAGIRKKVSPHVFRHTCATHLLEGGADISQVQRLLGHVLLNTTQIYTRVAQPEIKRTHKKTHPREKDRR